MQKLNRKLLVLNRKELAQRMPKIQPIRSCKECHRAEPQVFKMPVALGGGGFKAF